MLCPECKGRSRVVDTSGPSDCVMRRRECKLCQNRWTTAERFFQKKKKQPKEPARTRVLSAQGMIEDRERRLVWDDDWEARLEEQETLKELGIEYGREP